MAETKLNRRKDVFDTLPKEVIMEFYKLKGRTKDVFDMLPEEERKALLDFGPDDMTYLCGENLQQIIHDALRKQLEARSAVGYPTWVGKHLTPQFEATTLRNPGEVELWLDDLRQKNRQLGSGLPRGYEIYSTIQEHGLLKRSISFGDLNFLETNLDRIPINWRGLRVYGWASVVRDAINKLDVPFLNCCTTKPYIDWRSLDDGWDSYEPAGLHNYS